VIKALDVWWRDALVGTLSLDENGDLTFSYAAEWLDDPARPAISASLPRQAEPFNRRRTRPFFAGLLPEESQRAAVARVLGVSEANDFRLLERLGGDVAGALTLWPTGRRPPEPGPGEATPLDEPALAAVIADLPRRPLMAGREGIRLSLAGAQAKLPVVIQDGRIALPAPGQPTTHILKPPMSGYPDSVINEAFGMRLAARLGLRVAPVEIGLAEGLPYLRVERNDRTWDHAGRIERIHQEDFSQALGYGPEQKYASDGGPGFRDCYELVRAVCTPPAPAVLGLTDAAIFNVLLGNADAHSKNFSLLYDAAGRVTLAPLYDLLCTAAWPQVAANLAMRIARRSRLEDFKADTWSLFAADMGVSAPYVRRRVQALGRDAGQAALEVAAQLAGPAAPAEQLQGLVDIVVQRSGRLFGPGA
jgi:serine/threonine-protein kinase HipA